MQPWLRRTNSTGCSASAAALRCCTAPLHYAVLCSAVAVRWCVARLRRYVAAFAVSTYATFYKRAQKPFNSLLHETYECVRDDKGFRFLAEKVEYFAHRPIRLRTAQHCCCDETIGGWSCRAIYHVPAVCAAPWLWASYWPYQPSFSAVVIVRLMAVAGYPRCTVARHPRAALREKV